MPRIPSMNGRCGLDGISHCLPSRELYFPHKAQPRQTPPTLIDSQNTFYFQHTGNPFVVTLKRKAKKMCQRIEPSDGGEPHILKVSSRGVHVWLKYTSRSLIGNRWS